MRKIAVALALGASAFVLSGCLVAAAGGAVVGTGLAATGAVIGTTAKVGGAVVGAGVHAVTGGDKKKNDKKKKKKDRDNA